MQTPHSQQDCHGDADRLPGFNPAGFIVLNFGLSGLAGLAAGLGGASPLTIALAASLGGAALTLALILFAVSRLSGVAPAIDPAPHPDHHALS